MTTSDDFSNFEQLRQSGTSPQQICAYARAEGMDEITLIRMLRRVCGLSLAEAKQVMSGGDTFAKVPEVTPGQTVYWEGWTSTEGFYLMQAKVAAVANGIAHLSAHRKFRLVEGDLEEIPLSEPAVTEMRVEWLRRPLVDRFEDVLNFIDKMALPLHEAI